MPAIFGVFVMLNIFNKVLLHCSIITFLFPHQLRPEMYSSYCDMADILTIFVGKNHYLSYSEDDGRLIVTYNKKDQIIIISIYETSKFLHLKHLTFNPIYHEDSDVLKINFVKIIPPTISFKKT